MLLGISSIFHFWVSPQRWTHQLSKDLIVIQMHSFAYSVSVSGVTWFSPHLHILLGSSGLEAQPVSCGFYLAFSNSFFMSPWFKAGSSTKAHSEPCTSNPSRLSRCLSFLIWLIKKRTGAIDWSSTQILKGLETAQPVAIVTHISPVQHLCTQPFQRFFLSRIFGPYPLAIKFSCFLRVQKNFWGYMLVHAKDCIFLCPFASC